MWRVHMRMVMWIAFLGLLAMTAVLAYGFMVGDFIADGAQLLNNPWGVVSIVDLYTGFTLFSIWIVFREKSLVRSLAWVALVLVLGFFAGCLYVLYNAFLSKGDWKVFWMGQHASS
jgi:hypothetical protein